MNATDFTKNKMHFTIGLLAALFALHPFFPQLDKLSFMYMGVDVPLTWALLAIGVLLASAVYCYATDMMSESPSPLSQRLGNWLYATAIMTVPIYCGLWVTTLFETYLVKQGMLNESQMQTPLITVGILVIWIIIWQLSGFYIRHYLSKRDWSSRVDQLVDKEMDALKRAKELLDHDHGDLACIQYFKAVHARLKMATMKRGFFDNDRVILNAKKCGIVNESNEGFLGVITTNNAIARSITPVNVKAAAESADAAKRFLSTVAV